MHADLSLMISQMIYLSQGKTYNGQRNKYVTKPWQGKKIKLAIHLSLYDLNHFGACIDKYYCHSYYSLGQLGSTMASHS